MLFNIDPQLYINEWIFLKLLAHFVVFSLFLCIALQIYFAFEFLENGSF